MGTRGTTWFAFAAAAVIGFGVGCVVDLPEDGKYACTTDADCGGGGDYRCTPAGTGPRFCCKPSGAETCDGQDNDCNGVADDIPPADCYTGPGGTRDVGLCRGGTESCADGGLICAGEIVPRSEICNSQDDDCDSASDETFDFRTDPLNCGRCGVGCAQPLRCEDGGCAVPIETICSDGLDNDGDNARDCADSDCVTQSCGTGCVCRNFQKVETVCGDSADNDTDTATDCADNDCDGGSCGTGCQCLRGNKLETACNDTNDNDGDGPIDCADVPDCDGQPCGTGCSCAGGLKTEIACGRATPDEDNDGNANCADSDCDGDACGTGCLCAGGTVRETVCSDTADNDGDGPADCADTDCDGGSCNAGGGCACVSGQKTETNCIQQPTASGDEDGDGNANCADQDCLGRPCRTNSNRTCQMGGACQ